MLQDFPQFGCAKRLKHHRLVDAVHEFRGEFPPRGFHAGARDLVGQLLVNRSGRGLALRLTGGKAQAGLQNRTHLRGAQVAGHEDQGAREIHAAVVAQSQCRLIQNAQQQVPQRVAGFFDLVEQHEAQLHLLGVVLVEHFLAQQRMRFAMPQISGRRADQFGDLMAMLKLSAIDLDHRAAIAHQAFGRGFHQPRLAGAGGPEK